MKKLSLLTLFFIASVLSVSAQAPWKAQKKKLSSISVSVSPFSETLVGLSHEDVLGLIEDPGDRLDMTGFGKADYFTTELVGASFDVKVGFAKQIRKNLLSEVQIGLSTQAASELVLDYNYLGSQPQDFDAVSSVGLCYMHNRLGVSAGYRLRGYGRKSSFSIGPSFSGAKTFNDVVIFLGGTNANGESSVDARSSTVTRLDVNIDYSHKIAGNLAFNLGARYGYTYFISPYNENSFGNNYGMSLGFEYQFFRNKF